MPSDKKSVRPSISEGIQEVFGPEFFRELAEEIKQASKQAWGYCPKCRGKVQVEVKDLPAIVRAVKELVEQAEGRAATAEGESGGVTLIVERNWPDGSQDQDEL